jgi:hypothetical protein
MAPSGNQESDYLRDYGLVANSGSSAAARVLLEIQPTLDSLSYERPSLYIQMLWDRACAHDDFVRDIRGKGFELIIACALIKEGILPFYWQAEISFVPMVNFDLVVYTHEIGPIVLSLKTSMRERYKQAEFEAQILKNVHRRSRTFLVTLDSHEASVLEAKIERGLLTGIEKVAVANESSFDEVINILKSYTPIEAPSFQAIINPKKIAAPTGF